MEKIQIQTLALPSNQTGAPVFCVQLSLSLSSPIFSLSQMCVVIPALDLGITLG